MNRMEFFEKVILGGGALLLMNKTLEASRPPKQKILLGYQFVTGFQYYDGPEVADLLEPDLTLVLNREPHNRWDSMAVEVYAGEAKLGYIPRNDNRMIASLIDSGIEVKARIAELNPDDFPYGSVKVEMWYER